LILNDVHKLNGADQPFEWPNIDFEWKGFNSKSPFESSRHAHVDIFIELP